MFTSDEQDLVTMVGIVIVSHSHKLAVGVKEMAEQISQGKTRIATAGGLDRNTLGTSATRIARAIRSVAREEGALVLMDLGSSLLNTRMAIELLPDSISRHVILSPAPLVEGAISAAIEASTGGSLSQVDAAARATINTSKLPEEMSSVEGQPVNKTPSIHPIKDEGSFVIVNHTGLHARSAVLLIRTAREYNAKVNIRINDGTQVQLNGNNILEILKVGGKAGDRLIVETEGKDARKALKAIGSIIQSGFGEMDRKP
jgi:multiphosphoryl transfer protein